MICRACGSESVVKDAFWSNKLGTVRRQRYKCKNCGTLFVPRDQDYFYRGRVPAHIIMYARGLRGYGFSFGMIRNEIRKVFGLTFNKGTIWHWVKS